MNVALFDYGAGNLHSLGKALGGAGARVTVTGDWDVALKLDALVLPGVGHAPQLEAPRVVARAVLKDMQDVEAERWSA